MSENNVEQKKEGPRITQEDIEGQIKSVVYFTAADGIRGSTPAGLRTRVPSPESKLHTFCLITLLNGFTVSGESVCVSPENFNVEIGRERAFNNAINKLWMPFGFLLTQRLYEGDQLKEG